jgi:hypothetical protein
MNKQIKELQLYFDTPFIHNQTTSINSLTPSEFTAIKLKIKSEKKDGAYPISSRIYIQLMDREVFIYQSI